MSSWSSIQSTVSRLLDADRPRSVWRRLLGKPPRPRGVWGLVRKHADGSGETPLYWCSSARAARRLAVTPTFRAAGRVVVVSRTISPHIEAPEQAIARLNRDARPNLEALLRASLGPRRRERLRLAREGTESVQRPLL